MNRVFKKGEDPDEMDEEEAQMVKEESIEEDPDEMEFEQQPLPLDSQFHPRFKPENLEHNKHLFERVNKMARRKGCSPSQLALAWLHHQGDDVCPIPGTTKIENLNENIRALSLKLTAQEMAELESIASADAFKGDRYWDSVLTYKNSDTPPFSSWKPV